MEVRQVKEVFNGQPTFPVHAGIENVGSIWVVMQQVARFVEVLIWFLVKLEEELDSNASQ